ARRPAPLVLLPAFADYLLIAPPPSQFLSPKQPPPGNNRQIGEHQTEGEAHHKTEGLDPSRYDDDGQNVGDENIVRTKPTVCIEKNDHMQNRAPKMIESRQKFDWH